jgi:molybdate transport system permease protein
MSALFDSLILTLRIALCATVLVALVGVPLAWFVARHRFRGRSALETLLTLPLVLPPTVVGYLILVTLGARSPIGAWIDHTFGWRILFTEPGAVLASAVVSFPLLLLPARAAFASVEPEFEEIARLMGAGALSTFWHVRLPLARRGLASGLLLAFARALGEFGATLMVFGSFEDRRTLSISVYEDFVGGQLAHAWPAVVLLIVVSFGVIIVHNRYDAGLRRA